MRLKSFEVEGFKNLTAKVTLDDLGAVNVLHGENNVGKSNLLQAIGVFFRCLGLLAAQGNTLPTEARQRVTGMSAAVQERRLNVTAFPLAREALHGLELEPSDLFHVTRPVKVTLSGVVSITREDLELAGVGLPGIAGDAAISIELGWTGRSANIQLTRLLREGGPDVTGYAAPAEVDNALQLIGLAARNFRATAPSDRFAVVGVRRDADAELALAMYDARESTDLAVSKRWKAFVEGMREFEDITGKGEFVVVYNRAASKAMLLFETDTARIPLRLQGTGVQQLAALVGHLLMTNATIVAIEEPELNLRYTLQIRLREVLRQLVGSPGGPSQLFLSSHSPAFEVGDTFYAMRSTPQGPVVETRPVADAAQFTEQAVAVPPDGRAPLSYVTGEGLVKVPDGIRKELHIEHGGGVVFWKREKAPYVEVLTNDQFLSKLHGEGADGGPAKG